MPTPSLRSSTISNACPTCSRCCACCGMPWRRLHDASPEYARAHRPVTRHGFGAVGMGRAGHFARRVCAALGRAGTAGHGHRLGRVAAGVAGLACDTRRRISAGGRVGDALGLFDRSQCQSRGDGRSGAERDLCGAARGHGAVPDHLVRSVFRGTRGAGVPDVVLRDSGDGGRRRAQCRPDAAGGRTVLRCRARKARYPGDASGVAAVRVRGAARGTGARHQCDDHRRAVPRGRQPRGVDETQRAALRHGGIARGDRTPVSRRFGGTGGIEGSGSTAAAVACAAMSGRIKYNLLGIAGALTVWELVGRALGTDLFAPPSVVFPEYVALLWDGPMLRELATSLRRMIVGYGFACLIGIPVGAAMGRSRLWDALLHPWLSMFVVTSVASLVPLFILVFGTVFMFRAAIVFAASTGYVMLTGYNCGCGVE